MHEHPVERVLRLPPIARNPRNSEGDFIQLTDGRWLLIYTHFEGGAGDHASAYLASRVSSDGGLTWSHEDNLILSNEAQMNIMSVSLLRLKDQRIAMFYLRKNSLTDCRPCMRTSIDEAATWSSPVDVIPEHEPGYYVVNNNRVIQLKSGRLVVPAALHTTSTKATLASPADSVFSPYGQIFCYLSDDDGATWHKSQQVLAETQRGGERKMMQEPGVIELQDGRLMMFCRTDAGSQYVAYSRDRGESWSPLHASDIISPCSPASIARIPSTGDLLIVWNNHANIPDDLAGKRTPLTCAISRDEGDTWLNAKDIEVDAFGWFCYTAIAFEDKHVLLAHCAGDTRANNGLAQLNITRIPVTWLYE